MFPVPLVKGYWYLKRKGRPGVGVMVPWVPANEIKLTSGDPGRATLATTSVRFR